MSDEMQDFPAEYVVDIVVGRPGQDGTITWSPSRRIGPFADPADARTMAVRELRWRKMRGVNQVRAIILRSSCCMNEIIEGQDVQPEPVEETEATPESDVTASGSADPIPPSDASTDASGTP